MLKTIRAANNFTGGWRYHLRALRYSDSTWQPFRSSVSQWLQDWHPQEDRVILVGPSGGYCLDFDWLSQFTEVTCVDPDPLAQVLFKHRFNQYFKTASSKPKLNWISENYFDDDLCLTQWKALLAESVTSAILFCNFLGQLTLLKAERQPELLDAWKAQLVPSLTSKRARSWASFHDRLSGTIRPSLQGKIVLPMRMDDSEILKKFYVNSPGGELNDHQTEGFFPDTQPHIYMSWNLSPRQFHLIEALTSL